MERADARRGGTQEGVRVGAEGEGDLEGGRERGRRERVEEKRGEGDEAWTRIVLTIQPPGDGTALLW